MKLKRRRKANKQILLTQLFLVLLLFIGIGYSVLNTNLGIDGTVQLSKAACKVNNKLYNVIKCEAENNGLAKLYTGEHQDSMDTTKTTENIYHWYAKNDTEGTEVLIKNNVKLGDKCWQMIRTTDTGGVKLLYNGEYTDENKCNNTGTAQQIGTSSFNSNYNSNYNSPAYVGYMYNTVYPYQSKDISSETVLNSSSLGTNYYYGDNAVWGSPTANRYNLTNPQTSTEANYPNLVGKYTFRNTSNTYTSTTVQYITAVKNSTYYYIQLGNESGSSHNLSYYNHKYTYGDSFTNNNGTYTINNPTTIERKNWYSNYSNFKDKYVCKNATNNTCSDLWYVTSSSNTSMSYIKVNDNYKYANGFTYKDGKYKLNDDQVQFWNLTDNNNKTSLNNHHYTCFNESGECTNISYIYYMLGTTYYYINISGGKSIEDAKNEMLYADNVNTTNSTIKTTIDNWYAANMTEYDSYLEDTIFCNDRSQRNADTNGWNPNGGIITTYMNFKEYSSTTDLICANETDKFSTQNNKAKLTYKVGLVSSPEMNLLNNSIIRRTGELYWLGSPNVFGYIAAVERNVYSNGYLGTYYVNNYSVGVRPAVSLVTGTEFTSGTGTVSDPYVIQ